MKRLFTSWTLLCVLIQLWAQAPSGYYTDATGYKGQSLKTALYRIITDHTARSYKQLWTDMQSTDRREDGKVWDMYSSTTDFTFTSDQCGTYKTEGDCYNREHSFPKSWFNDASPMYTDLFHLYPTDGYVNNRRGNYPFGETNGEQYKSNGGYSKLGKCTSPGYSGTVFEPDDEYKGDFARSYFYMATCYEDRIATWNSDMLAHNSYPAYAKWALDMLLRWAAEDPVSPKEIARNNAVYKIQKNRNPYIDFPGLEQYVWGSKTGIPFDPDNYDGGGEVTPPNPDDVATPTFTPSAGSVDKGTTVTISTTTPAAYIVYSLNGGSLRTEESPVYVEITEPTTIEAYAMKEDKTSETVSATYTIVSTLPDEGVQTFKKVNSTDALEIGKRYLIVCEDKNKAMGAIQNDFRSCEDVTIETGQIRTEVNGNGQPFQVILGGQEGAYTLYDATAKAYLSLTSDKNKLHNSGEAGSKNAQWTITVSGGQASIQNNAYKSRTIQYNASSPRFACYTNGQQPVTLYVNTTSGSGIKEVVATEDSLVDVYTINGQLVRQNVQASQALNGLKKGMYVIKGNKVLVK
mgnify:FL=1